MNRINLIQNHRIWLVAVFCLFVNVYMLAENVSIGTTFIIDNISYCVTSENEVAVYRVQNLEVVEIPDEITYKDNVYQVTSVIYRYKSDSDMTDWSVASKIVFGKNIKKVDSEGSFSTLHAKNLEEVVLNEGLEEIGDRAFCDCTKLRKINLPKSLKKIGEAAFRCCQELRGVIVIPDGVTYIPKYAFQSCSKIEGVDCGKSVTKIDYNAFSSCYKLNSVIIRKNIKEIGDLVFDYCKNLTQIKVLPELPPNCKTNTFGYNNPLPEIYTNATLYVPKGSKPWYYLGDVWKNFKNIEEKYNIGEKCKEPAISIVDNKIHITCDTKDADIYYSLKAIDNVEEAKYDEPIMPSTKYILTAYAKVDEFDVSETVSFPFTVIQEDPTKIVTIKADNDDASVAVNGKNILISTANGVMQPTIVSTTNGSLVYDGTVSGQSVIPVTQGGIYIVKAGNTTKKVLIK